MATFNSPVVPAFLAGTGPAATDLDTLVYQTMSFLQNRVVARLSQASAATTLPSSGVTTPIVFDTALEDPYSGFGAVTQFVQFLSGSGTFTWPAGLTGNPFVECWAGGRPGGNGNGTSNGGGGGGAGEYAAEPSLAVGATSAYTVGGPGVNSTLAGSSVTVTAHAGTAGTPTANGTGGTGSTNTTHFDGGRGGTATGNGGGGGGGSGGPASAGHHGSAGGPFNGGAGGAPVSRGGAGGQGGQAGFNIGSGGFPGNPGFAPGGGGGAGGRGAPGGSGPGSGAAGAGGQIRLTYSAAGTGNWVAPAGYSGWYQVTLTVRTAAVAALVDLRPALVIQPSGTVYNLNNVQGSSSGGSGSCATWTVYLVGGQDSVQGACQLLNSGANVNTSLTAGQQSTLEIVYLTQN